MSDTLTLTPSASAAASAVSTADLAAPVQAASEAVPSAATPHVAASTVQPAPPAALSTDAGASAGLWSSLAVTALALVFVLGLAWLFLYLLKRMGTLRGADGRVPPQVVQAIALGGRERLVVVRDGSLEYVLGVTANQVSLIDKRPAAAQQTQHMQPPGGG